MKSARLNDIQQRMASQGEIRTMSVIAHIDDKPILNDCLLSSCGVTLSPTAVSMCYDRHKLDEKQDELVSKPHLIHLILSPGNVDFSSDVTAALRITDGALVVVNCVEGLGVQTETVLRQAISEGIKPILFLNNLDRIFLELDMDLEEAYFAFRNAIETVNQVVAIYSDDTTNFEVSPENGTVGFGSGPHNWAFTLDTFADFYAKKSGVPKDKWMKKLWGDNFYDQSRDKWCRKSQTKDGRSLPRGFCHFVLKPIQDLCKLVMVENLFDDEKLLKKLKRLKKKFDLNYKVKDLVLEKEKRGKSKDVLKLILRNWLKCGDTLLGMICDHLPSPLEAQKHRVRYLYGGPLGDEAATAIANCDANGPLMFYISKMIPGTDKGQFYCLGRVFAGTLKPGPVRILGPGYKPGSKKCLTVQNVQRVVTMIPGETLPVDETPCGNIVAIVGIDRFITKNATLTTCETAHIIKSIALSESHVMRISVEPRRTQDLPKLVDGLKRLAESDQLVRYTVSKTGEHIISGAGELHLECAVHDLEHDFMNNVPIVVSRPVVSYCESVTHEAKEACLSTSKSKLNRLWLRASPLDPELCKMIEDGAVSMTQDHVERNRVLTSKFDWNPTDARKIWSFGHPGGDAQCNLLVNQTRGIQYLNEVKDYLVDGFLQRSGCGILCEEPLRGVRFDLGDVKFQPDSVHRQYHEFLPTTSRAMAACQLAAGPQIMEPVYAVSITVPTSASSGVYETLSRRRGEVTDVQARFETPLCVMKAYLPVAESFGFYAQLRQSTRGQAFPQMTFSHWQAVSGDVYEEGSPANVVVMEIRKRKGLPQKLPKLDDYNDRL